MTTERYVTWATNERDEKILVALSLDTTHFKVLLHVFSAADATTEFSEKIFQNWVKGEEVVFPENTITKQLELSDDALLPENIRVEKTGAIRMLQNEWSYKLLTTKLWESFNAELDELKSKARELTEYSQDLFDQSKSYWERALEYRKGKDLSQEKLTQIKEEVNQIFDHLKHLRTSATKQRDEIAEKIKESVNESLSNIQKKLAEKNIQFKPLIEELKGLQAQLKDAAVRREVKNALYDEIQKYFELVKNQRGEILGNKSNKRLEGLTQVLEKLEKSLAMDKKDLEYNLKRIEHRDVNKLELQLRQAKMKVIQDKIASKEEKLADIKRTYEQVKKDWEKRMANKSQSAEHTEIEEEATEELTPQELQTIAQIEDLTSEENNKSEEPTA